MFKHVYPGDNEAEETEASFDAMIEAIPQRIKRAFGYRVMNDARQMDEEEEIDRLEQYTRFAKVKRGSSD